MSLQDKLDEVRKEFESSTPPEAVTIMHRAIEDLRNPEIIGRVLKKGDCAPQFTLPDVEGQMVSSTELLSRGVLVVSFYRGVW
jgi:hypothetical protein